MAPRAFLAACAAFVPVGAATGLSLQEKHANAVLYLEEIDASDDKPKACHGCHIADWDRNVILQENHESNTTNQTSLVEGVAHVSSDMSGDLMPKDVYTMLAAVGAGKLRNGRFYDLGSGMGKVTNIAAKTFYMKATGIELSRTRHGEGCKYITHHVQNPVVAPASVQLVHGSMFDYDLSDADIVFVNSLYFTQGMMNRLSKVLQTMPKGSKVVSYLPLVGDDFKELKQVSLRGTWGETSFRAFEKVTESQKLKVRKLKSASNPKDTPEVCTQAI